MISFLHIFHLQYLNRCYDKIFEWDPPSVLTEKLKYELAGGSFAYANYSEASKFYLRVLDCVRQTEPCVQHHLKGVTAFGRKYNHMTSKWLLITMPSGS